MPRPPTWEEILSVSQPFLDVLSQLHSLSRFQILLGIFMKRVVHASRKKISEKMLIYLFIYHPLTVLYSLLCILTIFTPLPTASHPLCTSAEPSLVPESPPVFMSLLCCQLTELHYSCFCEHG